MENQKKSLDKWWIILISICLLTIITFLLLPIYISFLIFAIIYLPIIIYILIYKWIKRWFASAVFSFSVWLNLIILIIPILLGFAALDISDFAEELKQNPKYITINDDGLIFATEIETLGFNFQAITSQDTVKILTKNELNVLEDEINSEVKNKVVFVLEKEVFRNFNDIEIEDQQLLLTKDQAFKLLGAENIEEFLEKELNIKQYSNFELEKTKIVVLTSLLEKVLEVEGPDFLVRELKNNNIKIFPERYSIKLLITLLPENILSDTGLIPDITGSSRDLAKETITNKF